MFESAINESLNQAGYSLEISKPSCFHQKKCAIKRLEDDCIVAESEAGLSLGEILAWMQEKRINRPIDYLL